MKSNKPKQIVEQLQSKTWFKVLSKEGESIHGGTMKWSLPNGVPGEWHEVNGEVECCSNGLHFTCEPKQWAKSNCRFFIAELDFKEYDFENDHTDEKICVRRGRLVREATAEELFSRGIYITGIHSLTDGFFYVGGNATVKAGGNATVKAGGNATVEAGGNATVKACDNATVEAWGNAYILFYNDEQKHSISDYAVKKDYYTRKI